MTRIDFYSLNSADPHVRLNITCNLIAKAIDKQHRVLVQVNNKTEAEQLSQLLWSYRPESFLAHSYLTDSNEKYPDENIQIGWLESPGTHHDLLIQLSAELPAFFSRFNRMLEVVCQVPEILESGRMHFRICKERGYPIHHHQLNF